MEKILVSIDCQEVALGAFYRAIHLAIRIKAMVYVLQVVDADKSPAGKDAQGQLDSTSKEILDSMIEMARSEGVTVNYYVTQGDYMEELVRFVRQKNITLLVLGFPDKGTKLSQNLAKSMLDGILKQVNCAVELVHQRAPLFMGGKPL